MISRIPVIVIFVSLMAIAMCNTKKSGEIAPSYDNELLQKVRAAALTIPGELPVKINFEKYAESIRKWNDVIEGGSEDPCKMGRTAFQVEYANGWIMVDAGMDRAVHRFFEKEKPQPFDESKAARVRQAVQNAKLIVITHEHGDHVANVIRTNDASISSKTILTKDQATSLMNNPQMPEIKLDSDKSRQYIIADFKTILPVAPGMVLIKAPGHTKGEIIIYIRLQNGKEYIATGDVSWCFNGVAEKKQKPRSERKRVGENAELIEQQLTWLNELMNKEKITMLVSHDDIMLPQYVAQGLIGDSLKLK